MHCISSVRRRPGALASAALVLLALCLLAVGVQALTDPAATAALVVSGPGLNELDHDLALQNGTPTPTPAPSVTDGPAPYRAHSVPGRIEAEDYDFYIFGGEGVTYHDTTPGNSGGAYRSDDVDIETGNGVTNVGWIRNGEYLTYTVNVAQTGDYYLALRAATPNSGCEVEVSVDGWGHMVVFVPNTGSFATYTNATDWGTFDTPFPTVTMTPTPQATGLQPGKHPIRLSAGMHTLKVAFQGDGQNLDWIEFTPVPEPTPRPTSAPYRPLAIPGTIQAEDYDLGGENVAYHDTTAGNEGGAYRHDGVDIETAGGITAVGWVRDGEWLGYTVNVTQAGSYLVTARVASPNSDRTFTLWVDGYQMVTLMVPDTGSFETFAPAIVPINYEVGWSYPVPVKLEAGTHTLKVAFQGDGQNLDWIAFDPVGGTPTPAPTPSPYKNVTIPGTVQAEDYDLGGEGVAYHDTTPGNSGGVYRHEDVDIETVGGITDVRWIRLGEWLKYTVNVSQAGVYDVSFRVSSPRSDSSIKMQIDGADVCTVMVPNTGSYLTYQTKVQQVSLPAGTHTLKLTFQGDGQNLDWIAFDPVDITPTPVPTPSPYKNVTIPGTIQAEDYDLGGEGVAYHDTTTGNTDGAYRQDGVDVVALPGGGCAVGGIEDGEWLNYSVNTTTPPASGYPYPVEFWVASDREGRSVQVEVDGTVVRNVSVPNTGSLQTFEPVQVQFGYPLSQPGDHTIRLVFRGDGQALDRVVLRETRLFALADAYTRPNFTATPTNGTTPLTVRFTDTSSDFAYGWHWDFGDGATAGEKNPVHTFQRPGVYSVNLTIREEDHWGWDPAVNGTVTGWAHFWYYPDYPFSTKTVQVTVEGTGPGTGHAIPGTIEAEDYDTGGEGVAYHDTDAGNSGGAYRQDDVDIETVGEITNVGWIRSGEWLAYTATIDPAETYAMWISLASPNTGRSVVFSVDGETIQRIMVPQTGSFAKFSTVMMAVNLPAGTHTLKLTFQGDGQNIDWISFTKGPVTTPVTPIPVGQPYPGPHAVPGRVEAEDYDLGGFSDTTPANEGGAYRTDAVDIEAGGSNHNVGWIRAGEYLEYSVDTTRPSDYCIDFRVANPGPEQTVTVRVNGEARTLTIPATGSFDSWQTATLRAVWLNEGRNMVRVDTGAAASFNFDYLQFTRGETLPPTPVITTPPTTPVPSGGASFAAVPVTAPKGSGVKFTVTPAAGKTVSAAWWSFDAPAHLNTWNSRNVNPTFYYPAAGTFSPLVKLTYTDGSTETVQRAGYVRAT